MRGGARKGAGRPVSTNPKTVVYQFRCTEAQRQQIKELGGAKWVLRLLEAATGK